MIICLLQISRCLAFFIQPLWISSLVKQTHLEKVCTLRTAHIFWCRWNNSTEPVTPKHNNVRQPDIRTNWCAQPCTPESLSCHICLWGTGTQLAIFFNGRRVKVAYWMSWPDCERICNIFEVDGLSVGVAHGGSERSRCTGCRVPTLCTPVVDTTVCAHATIENLQFPSGKAVDEEIENSLVIESKFTPTIMLYNSTIWCRCEQWACTRTALRNS